MKIYSAAVFAIYCIPSTAAFVATTKKSIKTQLNLKCEDGNNKNWDHMIGAAMTGLAGLTLASQMAVAASMDPSSVLTPSLEIDATPIILGEDSMSKMPTMKIEISPVSAISGSSIQIADDYLDLSLPSYGDSVISSAKAKSESNVPAFSNPFSDTAADSDTSNEDKVAAAAAKQAKKEAAIKEKEAEREEFLKRKAEEKEAREADKAAKEQAAAERKAADEAAAAEKKAEKEARREAEKEKQRLSVQRANEEIEEKDDSEESAKVSLPDVKVPEFKAPDFSGFKAPDVKVPEFKAPDFSGFKAPEIKKTDYKLDVPEFKAPDVKMPEVSLPKFTMPKIPDMPKADTSGISTPSFSVPSTKFEAPKVPSFSTPSFGSSSSSSGGYASLDENIVDDQEERDVRAKEARTAFNEADASAREVENKAKQLRSSADNKKKIAKEAKDIACETRFGGKFLCIRPFGVGY